MKTITIFGSSSDLIPEIYKKEAHRLGELIASEGWHQYNGGGASGVMGAATRGGLRSGGKVHGIIDWSLAHMWQQKTPSGKVALLPLHWADVDRKRARLRKALVLGTVSV